MKTKLFIIYMLVVFVTSAQEANVPSDSIPDGAYFDNQGSMSVSGYYKNNLKTGNWITYFKTGQINIVEHYELGKKNGLYLKISKRGYIVEQAEYSN
ncbi:MAG TPA: hypothetical protein QF480_05930, partial [Bacteroidales bacterium]|nr:hypothetical protein [Bacteroidales bacterium]